MADTPKQMYLKYQSIVNFDNRYDIDDAHQYLYNTQWDDHVYWIERDFADAMIPYVEKMKTQFPYLVLNDIDQDAEVKNYVSNFGGDVFYYSRRHNFNRTCYLFSTNDADLITFALMWPEFVKESGNITYEHS